MHVFLAADWTGNAFAQNHVDGWIFQQDTSLCQTLIDSNRETKLYFYLNVGEACQL